MLSIKLCKTDIPKKQRKPIHDAVCLLYKRHVKDKENDKKRSKQARWNDFASALKQSLDQSGFKPYWHVLVGTSLGFACKKRNQTMGVWRVDGCMIVIWKSPGIEPVTSTSNEEIDGAATETSADASPSTPGDTVPDDATEDVDADVADTGPEKSTSVDAASDPPLNATADRKTATRGLRVLEPSQIEGGSEVEGVITTIREVIQSTSITDTQELAQLLRKRLTQEFGTIWHVVTGSEFVVDPAIERRNFVLAVAGKLRIVCFQHEQIEGTKMDYSKILKTLPYILFIIFGIYYVTKNSVCVDGLPTDSKTTVWLRSHLCNREWEPDMITMGGLLLGAVVLCKKSHWLYDYFSKS